MNQNVTEAQIAEARDWAADCMGMGAGVTPSAERAVAFVKAEYEGGWDAFVAECCESETPVPEQDNTVPECTCGQTEINYVRAAARGWKYVMGALKCETDVRRYPAWMHVNI